MAKGSAPSHSFIGKNLGKYYVVERLGQGGVATVYKAYQAGLSRYVAIKVLHSHLLTDETSIARFEHEAIAVASLRHPNIVQVFDFDLANDLYYMVMEFIDGSTLEARLEDLNRQGQLLSLQAVVGIINALASAIDYAHNRGIFHRDLKPSNIMFTDQDGVVLTDFGMAHIATAPRYTTAGDVTGTSAYMSPEQARGETVDERADIYALGVTLYEMATGRLPFEGDAPLNILMKQVTEPAPLPTGVNPSLPAVVEQVILKAMAKEKGKRYPSATELAEALQAAVAVQTSTESLGTVGLSTASLAPEQPGSMAEHLIGQTLDQRYQVLSLLGSGGMGTVFKGRDTTLQRDVAIKVMHPHVAAQSDLQHRFLQEARAAARLNHPGIAQVFDFGQTGQFFYIVLEFIPGHTLHRMLRDMRRAQRWIGLVEATRLVEQICLTLDYAHRQQVLHRDIKPNNIMIKSEPGETLPYQPVLMDLGLAKIIGGKSLTIAGASLGTPAYMSPEQAVGQPVDERSDIYALGILLYELVMGERPFPAKTIPEAVRYHTKEPPPPPRSLRPDLPEALEKIILTALAKSPAQRFAQAAAMAQALAKALPAIARSSTRPADRLDQTVSLLAFNQPQPAAEPTAQIEVSLPEVYDPPKPTGSPQTVSVQGDLIQGNKTRGDHIQVGHISGSGVAIGRDAQVSVNQGIGGDDLAQLFELIFRQIEMRAVDPNVDKEEIIEVVSKIQQEAAKGESANPRKAERWINNLSEIAPDIARATAAGLLASGESVSPQIRQIAAKSDPDNK